MRKKQIFKASERVVMLPTAKILMFCNLIFLIKMFKWLIFLYPPSVVWRCSLFRGFYNRDFNYCRKDPDMKLLSVVWRCRLFRVSVSGGSTVLLNSDEGLYSGTSLYRTALDQRLVSVVWRCPLFIL